MQSCPSVFDPHVMVVVLEGRLDALAAPGLEQALATLEAQGVTQVVLNFDQATYICSSSLRIVLIHTRRLRQVGGDLKLCCLPDKVAKVLCITGFDAVFEILPTEELAVQAFQISSHIPPNRP